MIYVTYILSNWQLYRNSLKAWVIFPARISVKDFVCCSFWTWKPFISFVKPFSNSYYDSHDITGFFKNFLSQWRASTEEQKPAFFSHFWDAETERYHFKTNWQSEFCITSHLSVPPGLESLMGCMKVTVSVMRRRYWDLHGRLSAMRNAAVRGAAEPSVNHLRSLPPGHDASPSDNHI